MAVGMGAAFPPSVLPAEEDASLLWLDSGLQATGGTQATPGTPGPPWGQGCLPHLVTQCHKSLLPTAALQPDPPPSSCHPSPLCQWPLTLWAVTPRKRVSCLPERGTRGS